LRGKERLLLIIASIYYTFFQDHISKHRGESWKYDMAQSIFVEFQGFWKCVQTLSWVFDIFSWLKPKPRRKGGEKGEIKL